MLRPAAKQVGGHARGIAAIERASEFIHVPATAGGYKMSQRQSSRMEKKDVDYASAKREIVGVDVSLTSTTPRDPNDMRAL